MKRSLFLIYVCFSTAIYASEKSFKRTYASSETAWKNDDINNDDYEQSSSFKKNNSETSTSCTEDSCIICLEPFSENPLDSTQKISRFDHHYHTLIFDCPPCASSSGALQKHTDHICEECFFKLSKDWDFYQEQSLQCPLCRTLCTKKGGLVLTPFEGTTQTAVSALTQTPEETFVALISHSKYDETRNIPIQSASFIKYHHNGSRYTAFGNHGITTVDQRYPITLNALVTRPSDGSIFATGTIFDYAQKRNTACVVALSAQGIIKKYKILTFKKNKTIHSSTPFFPDISEGTAIIITPDEHLFVAGYLYNETKTKNMFLAKIKSKTLKENVATYTKTSTLTHSLLHSSAHTLTLTPTGIVIVAGATENQQFIEKGFLKAFYQNGSPAFIFNKPPLHDFTYTIMGTNEIQTTTVNSITTDKDGDVHALGTESSLSLKRACFTKPFLLTLSASKHISSDDCMYTPTSFSYLKEYDRSLLHNKIQGSMITVTPENALILTCTQDIEMYTNTHANTMDHFDSSCGIASQTIIMKLKNDKKTIDTDFDIHKTITHCQRYERAPVAKALLSLPDNSLIIGGSHQKPPYRHLANSQMTLMKLHPSGTIDYAFGQSEES